MPSPRSIRLVTIAAAFVLAGGAFAAKPAPLTKEQLADLIHKFENKSRTTEDMSSHVVFQETMGTQKTVREGQSFERGSDRSMVMLFTEPKTVAGQGYLRIERNLWFYDPSLGKWDRRTDREQLSGTNVRASDLSVTPFSEQYDISDAGLAQISGTTLRVVTLKAKPDAVVPFPMMKLWIDPNSFLARKKEDYAESGKLLRTAYITKTTTLHSEAEKRDLVVPAEIELVDALDTSRRTVLVIKDQGLAKVPEATFTKAWLETKSR